MNLCWTFHSKKNAEARGDRGLWRAETQDGEWWTLTCGAVTKGRFVSSARAAMYAQEQEDKKW